MKSKLCDVLLILSLNYQSLNIPVTPYTPVPFIKIHIDCMNWIIILLWSLCRYSLPLSSGKNKVKDEEPTLSHHAVAYLNLAPLLYPGGMTYCIHTTSPHVVHCMEISLAYCSSCYLLMPMSQIQTLPQNMILHLDSLVHTFNINIFYVCVCVHSCSYSGLWGLYPASIQWKWYQGKGTLRTVHVQIRYTSPLSD